MRWTALFVVLVSVTGCAGIESTRAQELAWERWKKCVTAEAALKEIGPDGQIWFWTFGPSTRATVQACLVQAAAEQQSEAARSITAESSARGRAVAPRTLPAPANKDAKGAGAVWTKGDEWSYRWQSPRGSGTFVWLVDREQLVEDEAYYVIKSGTRREVYFRKADFAYFMDRVDGRVETRHTPPTVWAPLPLRSGLEWEFRYKREEPVEMQTEDIVMRCETSAEESVSVPAGVFKTIKVACRNSRTGAPLREAWISADVKQMVRDRTYFSYGVRERELTAFKVVGGRQAPAVTDATPPEIGQRSNEELPAQSPGRDRPGLGEPRLTLPVKGRPRRATQGRPYGASAAT